ncbi:MAG: hypothetical protein ABI047_03865 [Jatrophihabitantaceae bacterium]
MRAFWAAVLTPVLTLAFFMLGSPAATAFGSEVLGCAVDTAAWTANSCGGGGDGAISVVHYSPQNLSGTYSKSWTVTGPGGTAITGNCNTTAIPCIYSGCALSSTTCDIKVRSGPNDRTFTASLRLTQSGLTRTIQAQAVIYASGICLKCQ